jgi:hypothetical protein
MGQNGLRRVERRKEILRKMGVFIGCLEEKKELGGRCRNCYEKGPEMDFS